MQVKDTAICLRTVNYSETSQVVTLFTQDHGKVSAMAKGSRRAKSAFDGPIEVFSYGPVMFTIKESGGRLAALTEFNQQPRFRAFHANLQAMHAALFAAELTEHFIEEHDPHPQMFEKMVKFFETLQEAKEDAAILAWLILYQLRLLEETGVMPVLNTCVNCGATAKSSPPAKSHKFSSCQGRVPRKGEGVTGRGYYFSSRENGVLCSGCEAAFTEKRIIDTAMLNVLQNPAKLPKTEIKVLKEIERLLVYHFTELLNKSPKMAKYF